MKLSINRPNQIHVQTSEITGLSLLSIVLLLNTYWSSFNIQEKEIRVNQSKSWHHEWHPGLGLLDQMRDDDIQFPQSPFRLIKCLTFFFYLFIYFFTHYKILDKIRRMWLEVLIILSSQTIRPLLFFGQYDFSWKI